ncbi:MAG: lamin tail domain-containing protein, partial [Planctomycetes bacterium]|nr:lamin tail domain-containing protein [Planctomycetota bacterium]
MNARRTLAVILLGLVAWASRATAQTQTITYGWEGDTTKTLCGAFQIGQVLPSNVGAGFGDPVRTGDRSLKLVDNSGSFTPQAYLAWVTGLRDGDQVTASFWTYDTTPGVSPSGRVWAHWNDSPDDVYGFNGSAGGPDFTPGSGWLETTYTYTVVSSHTGIVIECRTYSVFPDTIWVDDLSVTVPDRAGVVVHLPTEFTFQFANGFNQVALTSTAETDRMMTLTGATTGNITGFAVTGLSAAFPTTALNGSQLFDPMGTPNDPNDDADLTVGGGTLDGADVRFKVGGSGLYKFTYTFTTDIPLTSQPATVYVGVQNGKVIITEIMHRPNNTTGGSFDPWEWVEIKNVSAESVDLDSLHATTDVGVDATWNLLGATIPAAEKRVILSSATVSAWLSEWNSPWRPGAAMTAADIAPWRVDQGYTKPPLLNEDTLFLFDWNTNDLLDAVTYRNGINGWPRYSDGITFFLEDGKYSATDNDDGANWKLSRPSANNAYQTIDTFGGFNDWERGSPMLEPGGPTVIPPAADNLFITLPNDGAAHPITLTATPDTGATVTSFAILSLPVAEAPTAGAAGGLSDPNGGAIVGVPYTLAGGGAVVNFTPAASGVFTFYCRATDDLGTLSNVATVTLYVQAVDQVVITEIMYDPANQGDNDWEWVEVYNAGSQAVTLGSLTDLFHNAVGNLAGNANATLAPGTVRILAPDNPTTRTNAAFLAEWARPGGSGYPDLTDADVIWVANPASNWRWLSNSGLYTMRLYASDGRLLDAVTYNTASPWPTVPFPGSQSIYLKPTRLGSILNDEGANWLLSANGEHKAYATPETAGLPTD